MTHENDTSGTKFHGDVFYASDVATRDASDCRRLGNPRVDCVDAQTIDHDQNTCGKRRIITAQIKRAGENLDRQIAIQGAKSRAFYNASHQIASRSSIEIYRPQYF